MCCKTEFALSPSFLGELWAYLYLHDMITRHKLCSGNDRWSSTVPRTRPCRVSGEEDNAFIGDIQTHASAVTPNEQNANRGMNYPVENRHEDRTVLRPPSAFFSCRENNVNERITWVMDWTDPTLRCYL